MKWLGNFALFTGMEGEQRSLSEFRIGIFLIGCWERGGGRYLWLLEGKVNALFFLAAVQTEQQTPSVSRISQSSFVRQS